MKDISYLVQIPFTIIGAIIGTAWVGIKAGFEWAIEYWERS